MSNGQDFLDSVIVPALAALDLDSVEARQLLLGTAMQESGLRDIDQTGGGPALGAFQIEPATYHDVMNWAAARHPEWHNAVLDIAGTEIRDAAVARLIYERAPGVIGATAQEQAAYYKQWYNTPLGAATVAQYLANWATVSEGVDFLASPLGGTQEQTPSEIPADAVTIAEPPADPTDPASVTYVEQSDPLPVLQPVDPSEMEQAYMQSLQGTAE